VDGVRHVLVLDGRPGPWLPSGFEVVQQEDGGLDRRLAGAFASGLGPAVLIGMDTPQIGPALLAEAVARLDSPGVGAVLGGADDGGWWLLGLRRPDPRAFLGVPMSSPYTGAAQRARLHALRLEIAELPTLRDVDTIADARAVARMVPGTRFARRLRAMGFDADVAARVDRPGSAGQSPVSDRPVGVAG
jgi:glycosyltransferase A (GT-A) superfamily protein (DUF2064 family)